MNSWDHLPNAKHIDRVIASVRAHPQLWLDASNSIEWTAEYWEAREAAHKAILLEDHNCSWDAIMEPAPHSARNAILMLIAYNDCAYMLDSDPGELAILVAFGNTNALILQAACIAFNKEKELV